MKEKKIRENRTEGKTRGNPNWKKGQSANPETQWKPGFRPEGAGRPKNLKQLIDDTIATEDLIKILARLAKKGNIAAITILLDRSHGKTPEVVKAMNENQTVIKVEFVEPTPHEGQ